MLQIKNIINLEDIDWENHMVLNSVRTKDFLDLVENGDIELGDSVLIFNDLSDLKNTDYEIISDLEFEIEENEFCLLFKKEEENNIYIDIFSLEECKILFGEEFGYLN